MFVDKSFWSFCNAKLGYFIHKLCFFQLKLLGQLICTANKDSIAICSITPGKNMQVALLKSLSMNNFSIRLLFFCEGQCQTHLAGILYMLDQQYLFLQYKWSILGPIMIKLCNPLLNLSMPYQRIDNFKVVVCCARLFWSK